jgi:hypothetical protein
MAFEFSEKHIDEFQNDGITVFRGILPPSLISDLRRVCDEGAAIVRAQRSGQVQRFQPVSAYNIDQQPFVDYAELPALRDALARVAGPQCIYGDRDCLGVLIEPQDIPYRIAWHRDARDDFDEAEWEYWMKQPSFGNQVNCALYEDSCTWYVPGSHKRGDTEDERRAEEGSRRPQTNENDPTHAEMERICLENCARMPGAVRLYLDAGDFALYSACGWHTGNYTTYKIRRTLHEGVLDPVLMERWSARVKGELQPDGGPAATAK